MAHWAGKNLKYDEVLSSIASSGEGLDSGIASVTTEENVMYITCNDGREVTLEFPVPEKMNTVLGMYVSHNGTKLTIVERANGKKVYHTVDLPDLRGTKDKIKCTQTVGGVEKGELFNPGHELESIVRQILSGSSSRCKVSLTTDDKRFVNGVCYLDITEPAVLADLSYTVEVTVPESLKNNGIGISEVWEEAGQAYRHDEIVAKPEGETFYVTSTFSGETKALNPDGYFITAWCKDTLGRTSFDTLPVVWDRPFIIGIYEGLQELDYIKSFLEIPISSHDGLEPSERLDYCSSIPADKSFIEKYHNMVDSVGTPTYFTTREVNHSKYYEWVIPKDSTGKLFIAHPVMYGKIFNIDIEDIEEPINPFVKDEEGNILFATSYADAYGVQWLIYVQNETMEYKKGSTIRTY